MTKDIQRAILRACARFVGKKVEPVEKRLAEIETRTAGVRVFTIPSCLQRYRFQRHGFRDRMAGEEPIHLFDGAADMPHRVEFRLNFRLIERKFRVGGEPLGKIVGQSLRKTFFCRD